MKRPCYCQYSVYTLLQVERYVSIFAKSRELFQRPPSASLIKHRPNTQTRSSVRPDNTDQRSTKPNPHAWNETSRHSSPSWIFTGVSQGTEAEPIRQAADIWAILAIRLRSRAFYLKRFILSPEDLHDLQRRRGY